jgi:hypothetical protein
MKFNFRKISAMAASVLVAGMSVGMAAAANYPAPFIQGGTANVAIVYGTGSGVSTLDLVHAGNIQTDLQAAMGGSGDDDGSDTVVTGDSVQLAKSTDKFNLGDNWNSFYTSLDSDELSEILAEGTYKNDDNDEFDYEQEVVLGSATLTHFTDNDFNDEKPVLGFDLSGGTPILTYTLDFSPDNAESDEADWASFEGTTIEMLGKEYYVLSASNTTSSGVLELLDSANDAVLNEGETITLEAGDTTYEVSISFIGTDSVKMVVNGETTPSFAEDDTYKLGSGDYLGIKEINTQDYQGGIKQVEFSIGSGKIELVNGEEVEVNGEDVSDIDEYEGHTLTASFTQSSGDLDSFSIVWALDSGTGNDAWLAFDTDSTELLMPVFNNLKISLGNFVTGAEEVTSVDPDGDDSFTLETEVTDGEVTINLLYTNGTFFQGIGASSSEKLVTNATDNPTISWDDDTSYFVATWINGDDYETYVLEVTDIDNSNMAKNVTTIESLASGSNKAVILDINEEDEIGEITFNLTAADETAGTATIALSAAGGSGTVYADKIVTKEGLKLQLPHAAATNDTTATDGMINITGITTGVVANATQWVMNLTEEDKDGNVEADVKSFQITLGHNTNEETSVTTLTGITDHETEDNSDDYVGYMVSDLATKTMFDTGDDQDSIDVIYPGTESYAEVFLSEVDSELVAGSGGTGSSATPLGDVLVMDSEVSSVSSKNLIIVGGSCINSAAATVLGGAYCGAAFTDTTGVGSGQFLIQGFDGAYTTGKLALVVAGYDAADTVNAATYLRNNVVDTSKKYVGTSATSANVVVDEE